MRAHRHGHASPAAAARLTLSVPALAVMLLAGCLADAVDAPGPDRAPVARLSLNAQIGSLGTPGAAEDRTVKIRAFYRRTAAEGEGLEERTLPSAPAKFAVASGTTEEHEIVVQVAECLADAQRVGAAEGGCRLGIELTLLDAAGGTLVTEVAEPAAPVSPGATLDLGTVTLAEVGSVEIAPVTDSRLRVGRTLQLSAIAKNGSGVAVDRSFRWASSDDAVASVDPATGLVTGAKAGGPVTITASTGGKRGQVTLAVVPRVASVDVTPGSVSAKVNGAVQLTATPKDDTNSALTDRTIQWVADNSGVYSISPNGVVTGVRPGTGELTVTVEEVQRKVSVTVAAGGITVAPNPATVAIGGTTQLSATVTDANGAAITTQNIPVSWNSANPNVATVEPTTGLVTGRAVGQATITATGGRAEGQATVNVVSQSLTITPANATIQAARSVQLTAQGALGAVAWKSSDAAIADVSTTGVVSGKRPGTVTITGTSGAQTGNTSVTVIAARVDVTPNPASVAVGETVPLSAVVRDADGGVISNVPVSWESSDPAAATVNPATGEVTGLAPGQTTVTARSGGANAAVTVTVVAAPPSTIELTPGQPTALPLGNTLQLTAIVKDARGNVLAGRTVTFASSAPGTASVAPPNATTSAQGTAAATITGQAAGPATITASAGTKQASIAITVTPLPPSRITAASPDSTSCPVNSFDCQFAVKVTDSRGQPVSGATVDWFTVEGGPPGYVGTTDTDGISTATNVWKFPTPGTYTQTATLRANGAKVTFKFTLTATAAGFGIVSAGAEYSCAVADGGALYCWGDNSSGQLGDGTTTERHTPTRIAPSLSFTTMSAGSFHACAIATGGALYCWGENGSAQLGDGTVTSRRAPTRIGGSRSFSSVSAGDIHSCAIASGGALYCWGENWGQIGDGTFDDRLAPTPIAPNLAFTSVSAGAFHTCGITTAGALYCWGENDQGQLGDGTTATRNTPVRIAPTLTFTNVSAGADYTCGVAAGGALYCWGNNEYGQLGDGTATTRLTPTRIAANLSFANVSAGSIDYYLSYTCGVASGGALYCWGNNESGQLGDGSSAERRTPTRIAPTLVFTGVSGGDGYHTCAVTADKAAYCWGDNTSGQLGDGTTTRRLTPTLVKP